MNTFLSFENITSVLNNNYATLQLATFKFHRLPPTYKKHNNKITHKSTEYRAII